VVAFAPLTSWAGDNDQPRSLAAEADYLAQNSGQTGWVAEGVTYTKDKGKQKAKGKFRFVFTAAEGKSAGGLTVAILIDPEHGPKSMVVRGGMLGDPFALVDKDGKRYIQLKEGPKGLNPGPDPKVVATLEYSIKADELLVKPGPVLTGSGWELDPTKVIAFKPGKDWRGVVKDDGLRKGAPTQIDADTGYVADAKAWEKLWTAWRGKKALPKIDFEKELVVVITASGSKLLAVVPVHKDGDLRFKVSSRVVGVGPGPLDLGAFGYYFAVQPRKGLKTINGKLIAAK
jgi:hypothetical protein